MVKLLNLILDTGNYPSSWRKSFIIPIHKSGNKHDLIIYRGISLQNCITKLFSSALNSRLVSFYDNLFANHQFGFRTSHRTTDSLFSSPSSVRPLTFHILINSSVATGPMWTKLWWNGPLPKLCPVIPTSNQDGRQAKNRKKGGWNFNCSLLL